MGRPYLPYAPLVRTRPLAGVLLRHASLAVLAHAGRPLAIPEILARFDAAGFSVEGAVPHKVLADALRYEVALGRLRRVSRGRYGVGYLPKVTASRVRRRWREAVDTEEDLAPWRADSVRRGTADDGR